MERRNQIRGMHRVLFACALSWCTLVSVRPISALNPDLRISQYAHTAWRMQDGAFPRAFAATEVLRARGGGVLRGVPTTISGLPTGEGGPWWKKNTHSRS